MFVDGLEVKLFDIVEVLYLALSFVLVLYHVLLFRCQLGLIFFFEVFDFLKFSGVIFLPFKQKLGEEVLEVCLYHLFLFFFLFLFRNHDA